MHELLNSAACSVLFAYCFVIAVLIPHKGMLLNKLVMLATAGSLMAEIVGPFSDWLPAITWQSTALHTCLAVALLVWRKEAMCFIRTRFTVPELGEKKRRRLTDWIALNDRDQEYVSGGKG